jgi:predicted RNase H-like HicB family nuclease
MLYRHCIAPTGRQVKWSEAKMRKIIIHRSDPDEEVPYWVECPSLGIASMGESIDDAIRMIHEAIALHLEDLSAHDDPIPPGRC